MDDWSFINKIIPLILDLYKHPNGVTDSNSVVKFQHPEDLKKIFDFGIDVIGVQSHEALYRICEQVIKLSVHTGNPLFCNQLFGGIDAFGLAGTFVTEALNTSQYTFEVAPVFTLMECEMIDTFCKLFGYSDGDGLFSPGGSLSNMYGIVLARYKNHPDIKTKGMFGLPKLTMFCSAESHYSMKKGAHWLGIGVDNLVLIDTNANGKMDLLDLENKIKFCIANKGQPFFVNATAGTTVLGAFDDIKGISTICKKFGLWLHVDACLGGSAILSKKHRELLKGIEDADSIAWNPHKTLGVPLQCSMFLTKHKGLLHESNSADAHYLFQQDKFYDVSYDTGDKSIQCGRKVDVFKFWLMLKARGLSGFEKRMDDIFELSKCFVESLKARDGFRLVIDNFEYTNICFWYIPKKMRGVMETADWTGRLNQITPQIKEKMIKSGTMMMGYCPLANKGLPNFLRMVFTCFPYRNQAHIEYILNRIEKFGEEACP